MRKSIVIAALATVLAAGCSESSTGQATTGAAAPVLLSLHHGGTSLTVYDDFWLMVSSELCKSTRGDLTKEEAATLRTYMDDQALGAPTESCADDDFKLRLDRYQTPICWPEDKSGQPFEGLTQFYNEKAAKLADAPDGKCEDSQTVTPSHDTPDDSLPPATLGTAGSGA